MSERTELFPKDAEHAQEFAALLERARSGDGDAACRLGDRYREGRGVRYSPRQAFHWYAQSALAGDACGQNNLGACYEHGVGCAQSYARAVKWYRLSAAQTTPTAQANLAHCYLHGHGVPADNGQALAWFQQAAQGGAEGAAGMVEKLGGTVPPVSPSRENHGEIDDWDRCTGGSEDCWTFGWDSEEALLQYLNGTGNAGRWAGRGIRILAHQHNYRFNWYVAETSGGDRFIGFDLLREPRDEPEPGHGTWGYSAMSESDGPVFYSCPLEYLEMAPMLRADWRGGVMTYHAEHRRLEENGGRR